MQRDAGIEPAWRRKFAEGKMFQRLECARCRAQFNFAERPRVTQAPRCPACGGMNVHLPAA